MNNRGEYKLQIATDDKTKHSVVRVWDGERWHVASTSNETPDNQREIMRAVQENLRSAEGNNDRIRRICRQVALGIGVKI
jgi:predicted Zn-dependent protease